MKGIERALPTITGQGTLYPRRPAFALFDPQSPDPVRADEGRRTLRVVVSYNTKVM